MFESNVIHIGTKTEDDRTLPYYGFESNVIHIGTKTTFGNTLQVAGLRVM